MLAEARIAEVLGIGREILREERRRLERGRDWQMQRGAVVWTAEAAARVGAALAPQSAPSAEELEAACVQPDAPKTPAAAPDTAQMRLLPFVRQVPNPRLIECRDEAGKAVLVRVKNARFFVPGMMVPCAPVPGKDAIMMCLRPPPRRRGRW